MRACYLSYIFLSLDAEVDVSAGTIDISVMYSGLPIYSETRDLCDMATCPIKTGPLEIDFDQYLPPIVSRRRRPDRTCSWRAASSGSMDTYAALQNACGKAHSIHPHKHVRLQVPPGPYNVTLDAKAANGAELLCLQVLFDVTPPTAVTTAAALEHKAAKMFRGQQSRA